MVVTLTSGQVKPVSELTPKECVYILQGLLTREQQASKIEALIPPRFSFLAHLSPSGEIKNLKTAVISHLQEIDRNLAKEEKETIPLAGVTDNEMFDACNYVRMALMESSLPDYATRRSESALKKIFNYIKPGSWH